MAEALYLNRREFDLLSRNMVLAMGCPEELADEALDIYPLSTPEATSEVRSRGFEGSEWTAGVFAKQHMSTHAGRYLWSKSDIDLWCAELLGKKKFTPAARQAGKQGLPPHIVMHGSLVKKFPERKTTCQPQHSLN